MIKKLFIVTMILTMVLSASAFSKKPAQPTKVIDFNFDYIRQTYDYQDNFIYSPYSIKSAFASVFVGAKGKTAGEISTVFSYGDQKLFVKDFEQKMNDLQAIGKNGNVILNISNALWLQKSYPFNKSYLNICTKAFKTDLNTLDFINDTEVAGKINSWIKKNTNGMIKQIVPPGYDFRGMKLVITNAIYFKGDWESKFNPDRTHSREFTAIDNNVINTEFMIMKKHFNYARINDFQMVEIPYKGKELSLLILLPDNDLQDLLSTVVTEDITLWKEQLSSRKVNLIMPKFKMESNLQLARDLQEMGMHSSFGIDADFSGISDKGGIFISDVAHKAIIEVNETGSEAAAATMIGMTTSMNPNEPRPVDFIADHPFIYLIQDNRNGEILFIGILAKPEASKN